jgi:hypothetical protein
MLDLSKLDAEFDAIAELIASEPEIDLKNPTTSARLAARFTGLPIVVTICDEDANGTYWQSGLGPWIEARGHVEDIMLPYTIWHEVGHHRGGIANTSQPYICQEYVADFYACGFFERYLPEKFDAVDFEAKNRMRLICESWHAADLVCHPVPKEVAQWCGWEFGCPLEHLNGGRS